ncbi:DUF2029 domain-containing protein [Kitasatospora acidiphila]|uniref:DUF2029 domain-containing protein n=1 Tax=Kitasatospora acidiphila TaxID=2567942 RepID=A0A540W7S3_9ACTN|nr:glycosyltransferase family 87 protein [Kitasatospora acidiphila]TQF05072.1 DUF2029 domain-containing protein [Kitasatospora acidiphila]
MSDITGSAGARAAARDVSGASSIPPPPPFSLKQPGTWSPRVLSQLGYWACSRFVTVMTLFSSTDAANSEPHLFYQPWAEILRTGSFPTGDATWQYPPGAAGVFLAPYLVPGGIDYVRAFLVVVLIADFVVMCALLRHGTRPGRSLAGSAIWLLGLPLMLTQPYVHFDLLVTIFAVLGLLCLERRSWLGGGFAAIGATIKLWPAFAVLGASRGRGLRQAVIGFVASAVALTGLVAALFKAPFGFLHGQGGRGIEIESLPGSIILLAQEYGYHQGEIKYRYGSMEIITPSSETLSKIMLGLSVLGLCLLLAWRLLAAKRFIDSTPADAAIAALLVFVVTSRVISPQYCIWLIGVAAVCLSYRSTSQRWVVALVTAATALTTVEYPLFWKQLLWGDTGLRTLLVARNGLLLIAAVVSCVQLWRSTVSTGRRKRYSAH